MLITSDHIIKMTPKSEEDILEKVIFYGGFLQTYTNLMRFFKSEESSTAILRGEPGVGKKTLLNAIENNIKNPSINAKEETNSETPKKFMKGKKGDKIDKQVTKKNIKFIYLHPSYCSDDYTFLKYIATELNIKLTVRPSIQELVEDIENRKGINHEGKIVIVLFNFEDFCNQKQSLLYSLTHLTQHGKNINLLGVTMSLDCTRSLEKRVRSRLNALFYELTKPYSSREEYLEFASKLLGGHSITDNLKQKLEEMYIYGSRAILHLKWFLISVCEWNKKGKLTVKQPEIDSRYSLKYGEIFTTEATLNNLVTSQLQLLTLAACYVADKRVTDFNLSQLGDYCLKNNIKNFDAFCPQVLKNTIILERIKLFKLTDTRPNQTICKLTKFTLEISGPELNAVLKRNCHWNVHLDKTLLSKLLG